jgi:peptidoglycan/xylan/chitin deacetylase (PgdA/CDA1 family)
MTEMSVDICTWFQDRLFAYSMTYDEGFVEIMANALPIHEKYGFPGHVDVVAGQLGRQRNCYLSTMNGYTHMSSQELKILIDRGWSVGNHSYTHYVYPYQPGLNLYRELVWSKYILEDKIGHPVRIFTICNDKYNYPPSISCIKEHYLGCVYIDGGLNRTDFDVYKIGNNMIGSEKIRAFPDIFLQEEPYDWPEELATERLTADYLKGAWLLDTTHLVGVHVPQLYKNMLPKDLENRFSRLFELSNNRLWAESPDRILDYELVRRNTKIKDQGFDRHKGVFYFEIEYSPVLGIIDRTLSFKVKGTGKNDNIKVAIATISKEFPVEEPAVTVLQEDDHTIISVDVVDGMRVEIDKKGMLKG